MVRPFRAWPYAALADITHRWITDHLDITLVFRHPMDQDKKPANALWICEVDSVVKTVTDSAWQDEFTMLLTVGSITAQPDLVTIAYDGPDQNLTTTWNKQWEPWGAILSSDGALLAIGNFYGNEIGWSQVAAQNVWYTVSDADIIAGQERKVTFQNNQELKISRAGIYFITYYLSFEISIANKHILSAIEINGAENPAGMNHIHFGAPNIEIPSSGTGAFNLLVDDVISVGVATSDAGNPIISIDHIGLALIEAGHIHP